MNVDPTILQRDSDTKWYLLAYSKESTPYQNSSCTGGTLYIYHARGVERTTLIAEDKVNAGFLIIMPAWLELSLASSLLGF